MTPRMDPAAVPTASKNTMAPVAWRNSLRTRLLLWSSLTNLIVLAGVTLAFYAGARAVMIENAKSETRGLAAQTERSLQATLNSHLGGKCVGRRARAVQPALLAGGHASGRPGSLRRDADH